LHNTITSYNTGTEGKEDSNLKVEDIARPPLMGFDKHFTRLHSRWYVVISYGAVPMIAA